MTRPGYTGPALCALSAREAVRMLKTREVSPAELVEAALTRAAQVEPAINAMPTLCPDRARDAARGADPDTQLGGLPIGIKDLTAVAGVRTTWGTPAFATHVPDISDPLVLRLEARGGIVLGKTNTPEMGAGGNTFNAVFGATRNPWNTARTAGGSSGGAAASLAAGTTWLSHGSDLGGSLRSPANFCGVVGLRPSPGAACGGGFAPEGVQGPMARDVADVALMLDAMAGFDPVWPLSRPSPATPYAEAAMQDPGAVRIAYAPDLGGFGALEPVIRDALDAALATLGRDGMAVEQACPDLSGLDGCFRTLRGALFAADALAQPEHVRAQYKPTLKRNIAEGQALTVTEIAQAALDKARLYDTMRRFFETFDVLACAVNGLPPFPVETEFPESVAGVEMPDYLGWLRFSFPASVCGLPALSLPAGRTPDGLPVGLQLIGPPRGEARLLQIARRAEALLGTDPRPIDPLAP